MAMIKYIIRILLFFVIIVLIDICFGKAFDYMVSHSKGGDTKATCDLLMKDQYDIIIMGSSRATHHYIPSIIEEATGMTCYNAGADGNGIILMYGRYKLITNRYNPKVILYDVEPAFDIIEYAEDDHNRRYLASLKPYFFQLGIKEIFEDVSWTEGLKNYSGLFRYNGSYYNHLRNFVSAAPVSDKGYLPLQGEMKSEPEKGEKTTPVLDSLKLSYIRKLAEDAKSRGIEFIFVASPKYGADPNSVQSVKDIAEELDILFWDYTDAPEFQKMEFFKEPMHLNDKGAKVFTRVFAGRLVKYNCNETYSLCN